MGTQLDIDDVAHGNPLAERELAELREQNRVFRVAQKACEDCGPNEARWLPDGEPANLEAAAEDAYEWLLRMQKLEQAPAYRRKLNRCMAKLKEYMRPVSYNA